MPFGFKKGHKELCGPKAKPEILAVPAANCIAVRGKGDPNEKEGDCQRAIGALHAVAYTLKMSRKSGYKIEGFFDYVVPPLEGFWRQDNAEGGVDYADKASFSWISVIRLMRLCLQGGF